MHSDLEIMVQIDMINEGYNPQNPEDVKLYWENMLNVN
jgi:hypothetical protein